MKPIPFLFLSDAPSLQGGLSRITRDLASLLCGNPRFRVGVMGMGGTTSRHLPFAQYNFPQDGSWGSLHLEKVWMDFAGLERGIILTIWDSTRTFWLSRPQWCQDQRLKSFLEDGHFNLWGYFPIDATGPQDRLSCLGAEALLGYNRVLCYTKWASEVVERSIGSAEAQKRGLDWIPHGIDFNVWQIRDRDEAKKRFYPLVHEGDPLVGVVMTNQARKDWGLTASICRGLLEQNPRMRFWFHTDLMERYWSINALLADFHLQSYVSVTTQMTNDDLCWAYNACDLVMLPSLGEGFGYPLAEALACGTPVLHGDYAGGACWLRQADHDFALVPPDALRIDGIHNQLRPVFDPQDWVAMATSLINNPQGREALRASICHLSWASLWSVWERWFQEGL